MRAVASRTEHFFVNLIHASALKPAVTNSVVKCCSAASEISADELGDQHAIRCCNVCCRLEETPVNAPV
jgi:hypothetical protein